MSKEDPDLSKISTQGSSIKTNKEGKLEISLDKRVTARAFKEVLEFVLKYFLKNKLGTSTLTE
jgi:hypothetical protein